jgi:hypothetical protein
MTTTRDAAPGRFFWSISRFLVTNFSLLADKTKRQIIGKHFSAARARRIFAAPATGGAISLPLKRSLAGTTVSAGFA